MADVSPLKKNLQVEDLRTGAAASEATMQKVGSSVNFWNTYFEGTRLWAANGNYSITSAPESGVDGVYFAWSNAEIYSIGMYNLIAGSGGTTEFDLIRYPAAGGSVSLFSTRPSIPASAGANARIIVQVLPTVSVLFASSGSTVPVLATTQLVAGDMLSLSFIQKQSGGQNAGLVLATRPR